VQNNGTLQVTNGTFRIDGSGTNTSGTYIIASGADLLFRSNYAFNGGGISGLGTLEIDGSDFDIFGGTISAQDVDLNSGAVVDISGGGFSPTNLLLDDATLTGSSDVTITGLTTWDDGTMSGSGTTFANGGIDFTGFANRVIDRDVEHTGTRTWTASGSIPGTGTFTHQAGTLTMSTRFFMDSPFVNNGTVIVDFSTPDLIGFDSVFNEGIFQIVDGVFRIDDVSSSTVGSYTIDSGATLLIRDDYSFNGGNISGAGTLELDGSDFDILAGTVGLQDVNLIGGTTVDVNGGTFSPTNLLLDDGTLTGTSDVTISGLTTWDDGTMSGTGTTFANGGIDFTGFANRVIDRDVEHTGTRTWTASGSIPGTGTFTHQAGTLTMSTRFFMDSPFVNNATVIVDFVTPDLIGFDSVFNEGIFQIVDGIFRMDDVSSSTVGSYSIDSGATLLIRDDYSFNGGSISGAGTLELDGSDFDVLGGTLSPDTLNLLSGGVFDVNGGAVSISGITSVDSSSTLRISTTSSFFPLSTLNNDGLLELNAGNLTLVNGGNHSGDFNTNAGTVLQFNGGAHTFNSGSDTSGAGDIAFTNGTATYNTGSSYTVNGDTGINGGDAIFNIDAITNTLTHASGSFGGGSSGSVTTSTWNPTSGVTLDDISLVLAANGINTLTGTIINSAGTASISNQGMLTLDNSTINPALSSLGSLNIKTGSSNTVAGTVNISGGMLSGGGTLIADVNNSGGILATGDSPGILSIVGNYTQGASAIFQAELAGASTAGVDYDLLSVTGTATLDGTLDIQLFGGFSGNDGDQFDIISSSDVIGDFASINAPANPVFTASADTPISGIYQLEIIPAVVTPTPTPPPVITPTPTPDPILTPDEEIVDIGTDQLIVMNEYQGDVAVVAIEPEEGSDDDEERELVCR